MNYELYTTVEERRTILLQEINRIRTNDAPVQGAWKEKNNNTTLYLFSANSRIWNYEIVFLNFFTEERLTLSIVDSSLSSCRNFQIFGDDRFDPRCVAKMIVVNCDI